MNINFTTTATVRPDILEKTYKSFTNKLVGIDFSKTTIYINIDLLPNTKEINSVIEVSKKYFGNVIYNLPDLGNFTAALNWAWEKANSDVIFNLEDDWILEEEVNVNKIIRTFDNDDKLFQIALRAYPYPYDKVSLSPSFLHKRFYKKIAGNLDENKNPEVQLRGKNFGIEMPGLGIANKGRIITSTKKIIIKDIGREWIKDKGYKKPDKKSNFNSWIKK